MALLLLIQHYFKLCSLCQVVKAKLHKTTRQPITSSRQAEPRLAQHGSRCIPARAGNAGTQPLHPGAEGGFQPKKRMQTIACSGWSPGPGLPQGPPGPGDVCGAQGPSESTGSFRFAWIIYFSSLMSSYLQDLHLQTSLDPFIFLNYMLYMLQCNKFDISNANKRLQNRPLAQQHLHVIILPRNLIC